MEGAAAVGPNETTPRVAPQDYPERRTPGAVKSCLDRQRIQRFHEDRDGKVVPSDGLIQAGKFNIWQHFHAIGNTKPNSGPFLHIQSLD